MIYSTAISSSLHEQASRHLLAHSHEEDLCFGIWYPSQARGRTNALVHSLILPEAGDRQVHGNVSYSPAYFERALGVAASAGGGLTFMHSHVGPGWQGMSDDDIVAEKRQSPAARGATSLPLLGMTIGTDGAWSARIWEKTGKRQYDKRWCQSVRVVGDRLQVTYHDTAMPVPRLRPELSRTVSAWGPEIQGQLARLRIGIVGAGSVGSIVAEALARMGIQHINLIDFDSVETVNLDRLLFSTQRDAQLRRSKVEVLGRALRKSATASPFTVEELESSIVEEDGFRAALDCDVLFSCVDRPWPRNALNFLAYAHLIPVVDGGVFIQAKPGGRGLKDADWRAHIAAPTRRCLECLNQYSAGNVSTERDGYLDDAHYIAGLDAAHPIRRNENVFGFSLGVASLEILQFLAMVVAPSGIANHGAQMYHFKTATLDHEKEHACNPDCFFPSITAKGDRAGVQVTGRHPVAEQARSARQAFRKTWRYRIADWLDKMTAHLNLCG
jgi:ThiF family